MEVWYPEDIRKRIEDISTLYPFGFDKVTTEEHSSGVSVDLAQMELERYMRKRSTIKKIRRALKINGSNARDSNPTLFSTALYMLQVGKEVDRNSKKVVADQDHTKPSQRIDDIRGTTIKEGGGDRQEEDKSSSKQIRRRSRRATIEESLKRSIVKPIQNILLSKSSH